MVHRFQHLFDNRKEEVVVLDRHLRVVYANPAWMRRLGLSPSQVLNLRCHEISPGSENARAVEVCAAQQVFRTGLPARLICPSSRCQISSPGEELLAAPIFDAQGAVTEVVVSAQPVDSLQAATESVQNQHKQRAGEPGRILDALRAAVLITSSGQGLQAVLGSVLDKLRSLVDYDSASIALLEEQGWVLIAARGFPPDLDIQGLVLPRDDEKIGEMAKTQQPMIVADVHQEPKWMIVAGTEYIRSWLSAPLLVQGQMIGVLNLDNAEPGYYRPEDAQVVMAFANQAAIVIENARLLEMERHRAAQLKLLGDIGHRMLSILEADALLDDAVHVIQRQFGYYFVGVLLTDSTGEYVVVKANSHPAQSTDGTWRDVRFRIGEEGITGHVAATGKLYLANDVHRDPLYIADPFLPETRSELAVPIKVGQRVIGVLDLNSDRVGAFQDDDLFVAQSLADQLALGLENARLFAAEARRRREAETLQAATQAVSSSLELQTVFEAILSELRKVVPYDSASVQRLEGDRAVIIGGQGFPNLPELLGFSFDLTASDNPNRRVIESQAPLILEDAPTLYSEFTHDPHVQAGIRSWLGVPLLFGNRMIGMLALDKKQPGFYTQEHARLALAFAAQAAIAIENAALFEATARRLAELEAVRQASLSLTSSLELQQVLEAILENTLALSVNVQDAHIFLYEDEKLSFGTALWADGRKGKPWAEPRPDGLTYTVARQGKTVLVPDMRTHPLFAGAPPDWQGSIVGLPLKIGERVVGVMTVAYQQPRVLPEAEMNVLRLLADQAAIAIENARLFDAEHQSRLRLQSIQATTTALSAELHLDSLLDQIVTEAARAFRAQATSLMQWDETGEFLVVRASHGLSDEYTRRQRIPRSRVESVIASRGHMGPLCVQNLVETPFGDRALIVTEGLCSVLVIPLGRQMPISGVLNVYSQGKPRVFGASDIELAEVFAAQATVMIDNAHLYEETQQRLRELTLLFESSAAVSVSLDAHEVLQTIVAQITTALGAEGCAVSAWNREEDTLVVLLDYAVHSDQWEPDPPGTVYPLADYPASRQVLTSRRPRCISVDDPQADQAEVSYLVSEQTKSLLMVPMVVRDQVIGLMELMETRTARTFSATEISLCQTLANQMAAALENARLFQETEARMREMSALAAVGRAVTTLDLDDLLENIAENALQAVQAEISSVYMLDENLGLLVPKSVRGIRRGELGRAYFALGEGTIGRVAQTGQPLLVHDTSSDGRFSIKTEAAQQIQNTLTVPLAVKGRVIGTLEVCNKIGADRFTATDEGLLMAFAAQAAIAIENARLFQAEREQRELAEALRQAAAIVGSTLDLDQVLDHILEQASRVVTSELINVMLIEGEQIRLVRWRGYGQFGGEEFLASVAFRLADTPTLRQMQETGQAMVIPDTATCPDWVKIPEEDWLRSYAGAPIRVRDEVVGFLNVDSATPGFFNQTHANRLQAFADQASLAIANARLYQELSRHLEDVLVLNKLAQAATSTLDLDEVLHRGLLALVGVREFERVAVFLLDEDRSELWLHPALAEAAMHRGARHIPLGQGITGWVAKTGQPRRVPDVNKEANYIPGYPDTRSELAVPLQTGERIIGVLDVQSTHPSAYSEGDERFLVTVAAQLSTLIENAHLFTQAQQRVRELTALTQVSQALNKAPDLNTTLDIVVEEALALLNGNEASVLLIDPPNSDRLRIVAERGLGPELVEMFNTRPVYTHEGTYKRALRSGQIVEVPDTRQDPDFLQDVGSSAKSVTNVPLTTERGVIGLIAVDGLPNDDTTRRLLTALADMAAVAIDKEWLRLETSNRLAEVTTLYTLATQITSSLSPERVMESIVAILKLTLDCRACSIFLLEPDGKHLRLEAGSGLAPSWKGVARLQIGEGVSGRAIAERRSIYVPDTQAEPGFLYFDPRIRSLLVVPLVVRGKAIGTLSIDDIKPNAFDDEVRLMTIAAAQAAVAIENARLFNSLQQSYTDLEKAYEELRRLDQMKSEFVQNISHELRTPLTFIKGYIELLQDGDMGELTQDQQGAMNIVADKADVLAHLVDDIISLQQAGIARMHFEPLSLAELGHSVLKAAEASAVEAGITLRDEIPDALPVVSGDRQRLVQVFDNLLGNALKFSNAGDSITVRMFVAEGMIRTEVEDSGIGIPANQLSRIFDRFYQVDGTTTRRYGGTGLGLAIVKQIVEAHGGQVGVESQLHEGSTFHFTVPIADPEQAQGGWG